MQRLFIYLFMALLVSIHAIQGQDYTASGHQYNFQKANRMFDNQTYQDALDLYLQLLNTNLNKIEVKQQIAHCYRHLNNPEKAALFYAEVVNNNETLPAINKFHFADVLIKTGNYQKAHEWLQKYKQEAPDDERVDNILQAIALYSDFYKDSALYRIDYLDINTPESDFGASYYQDGIVFSSARKDFGNFGEKKYRRDNSLYLDLFYALIEPDGTTNEAMKFSYELNSKYHESSPIFYDNDRKVLFTRNNYHQNKLFKSSRGAVNLKLYQAEFDDYGYWKNIQEFPFNSDEYSVGHAALTTDSKTIYFVSDKPGGFGNTDIYFSQWINGAWSEPQNMGESINTNGREMFPYVHNDQWLYFASDGHQGMGGLDVYRLNLKSKELQNPGHPINTSWDDFALIRDPKGMGGFLSSNRPGGKGSDDIYRFEQLFLNLEATVLDEIDRGLIPGAQLTLTKKGQVIQELITDMQGKVRVKVLRDKQYEIKVVKNGYITLYYELSTGQKIPGELMTLELPLGSLVTLNGQVLDATSMEVLSDALVSIVNESTGEEQEIRSNQQGRFQIQLPKNQRYSLVGKHGVKTGMVMGYQPGNSAEDSLQLLLEHQVLAMEDEQIEALDDKAKTTLLGNGVQITGPIEIENIYYEFDRWEIGTEAAQALDKLVQVMIENPSLKIELSSHTDVRGTESYNQHLSQKRAQSAVAYMVTRGINQRRLTSKGYGESKLLNNCLDEFDCSEEQHQENRRTEFMVLEF